jgi:hypothetical protein
MEVLEDVFLADACRVELAAQVLAKDANDVLPQVVWNPVRLIQRDVDAGHAPVPGNKDGLA